MAILAFAGVQLVPDGTLIFHIILILVMIWILNRTFFRPINKVLAARDKNSGGRSSEAQEILNQARQKHAAFDSSLREVRNEGYQIIEEKRALAVAKKQNNVASVKEEVSTLLSKEKETIALETAEAQKTISAEAEKLAEKISGNILKA